MKVMMLIAALALAGYALDASAAEEPPVPGPLQVPAQVINAVERTLQNAALRRGELVPGDQRDSSTIRRYVADQVDFTKSAATRARAVRLAQGPDDMGLLCFYALGVKIVALRFADQAIAMGLPAIAVTARSAADDVQRLIDSKCGGPGGDLAMKEWNAIHDAAAAKVKEYLNRTAQPAGGGCWPVPAPGITACALTRDEVYVPKTGTEWALLCAGLAAGFVVPPLATALRGLTWAEVFAAASVATPAIQGAAGR